MPDFATWVDSNLDVRLRSGDEWTVLCPFHDDVSPSMRVNVVKRVFVCLACGAKGNERTLTRVFGEYTADEGTILDTLARLRTVAPVEPVQEYPESWLDQFDHPTDYWALRGVSPDAVRYWRLGFDPFWKVTRDKIESPAPAVTIPIRSESGAPVGVIRRHLDPTVKPRYRYPTGFQISRTLWGSWAPRNGRKVVLTEGALDAIAVWDADPSYMPVALLGSILSPTQARILRSITDEVYLFLDNDPAGAKAVEQVTQTLKGRVKVSVVPYPPGEAKDPGELSIRDRKVALRRAALPTWV